MSAATEMRMDEDEAAADGRTLAATGNVKMPDMLSLDDLAETVAYTMCVTKKQAREALRDLARRCG